ncbi:MAG: DnaJ domain-containing protein, partial [Solirubrobacteraceae bacterium]
MSEDPYSILGVSRHATDAEVERAYERLVRLFDPEHYPGSTEDAYRRLDELNDAYGQIRGEADGEAPEPEASHQD